MLRLLIILTCCAADAAGASAPRPESVPVFVVMRPHEGQRDPEMGLIGTWATNSVNKKSSLRRENFLRVYDRSDFPEQAVQAFRCFATTRGCPFPLAFTDEKAFSEALRASPTQEGYVVEVLPELVSEQLVIRAYAHRMKLANDVDRTLIRVEPEYVVVYTTRAPAALIAQKRKNRTALDAFWTEGDPRRIDVDTRRGLSELNGLFALLLFREGREAGDPPEAWQSLKDFPDKKRISCMDHLICELTFVFKDNGDSFIIVQGQTVAGWFDAAAAAYRPTVGVVAQFGVPR